MRNLPLIIGHRGASSVAPENTIAAFARAIEDGADGIEFDVRLARDLVPVVIHDATLARTGLSDGVVAELTSAELQKIDVGSWFERRVRSAKTLYADERIPTLRQVFELLSRGTALAYLEMKCEALEGSKLATAVANIVLDHSLEARVILASFDLSAIQTVKRVDARLRTAALFEPQLSRPLSLVRRLRLVDLAKACGADEIALHHALAGRRVIEKAKQAGMRVVLWTIDDPEWIKRACILDVDVLITNDPALMVRFRRSAELGASDVCAQPIP